MSLHSADILAAVRAALRAEERLERRLRRLDLECEGGAVSLSGEVPDVSDKKLVAQLVARVPGVSWVDDGLLVHPARDMTDEAIASAMWPLLSSEPSLRRCAIEQSIDGKRRSVRQPSQPEGHLTVAIDHGETSLFGDMPTWRARTMAQVLAWRAGGARNVRNWLCVPSAAPEGDDALAETVREVLATDPFVDAAHIDVRVDAHVATLAGGVSSETERAAAERDAWLVDDIADVVNDLLVEEAPSTTSARVRTRSGVSPRVRRAGGHRERRRRAPSRAGSRAAALRG